MEDTFVRIDLDTEASVEGEDEECATVGKNNDKTAKIKNCYLFISRYRCDRSGKREDEKIKLPAVRNRRSKQLDRKKWAVKDSIYKSPVNTDRKLPIDIIIDQLSEDDTGALFAQWDTIMNELVYCYSLTFNLMLYNRKTVLTFIILTLIEALC